MVSNEPVLAGLAGVILTAVAAFMSKKFGVKITPEQTAEIIAAVSTVIAVFVRKKVSPSSGTQKADGMTP